MPLPDPWYKAIPLFWPVIVTILGVTVSAAAANTRLNELDARVNYVYSEGSPALNVRLARIDERTDQMTKQLDHIDHELEDVHQKVAHVR